MYYTHYIYCIYIYVYIYIYILFYIQYFPNPFSPTILYNIVDPYASIDSVCCVYSVCCVRLSMKPSISISYPHPVRQSPLLVVVVVVVVVMVIQSVPQSLHLYNPLNAPLAIHPIPPLSLSLLLFATHVPNCNHLCTHLQIIRRSPKAQSHTPLQ